MGFKLTIDKKLARLLKANGRNGLISEVKKEFSKRGPIKVKQAIVKDIIKGISPVQGGGKWRKYSLGYKKEIRKQKTRRMKTASPKKQKTPVNLRLTGGLHRSLSSTAIGGFLRNFKLRIQFKNALADIHNRRGAGKSKVIRRLLPTKSNEKFNRKINTVLKNELLKSVDKVARQINRQ